MAPESIIRIDSATDTRDDGRTEVSAKTTLHLKVLGVCCRTGMTKIDCGLVHYQQDRPGAPLHMELMHFDEVPIPLAVRTPILNLLRESKSRPSAIPRIHALVGHMFSTAVKGFCKNQDIDHTSIDLIGARAHTVRRLSSLESYESRQFQPDWSTVLTAEFGTTTITDFSTNEHSEAHMSSPTTFVGSLLLRHPTKFRVCLDIDDTARISFFPPSNSGAPVTSYNCGPGNMLIDYAMRYSTSNEVQHDNNGQFAIRGAINQTIVDSFLAAHDYIDTPLPMHMTTEMFGDHEGQRLIDECLFGSMSDHDTLATITRVTAQNLMKQYRRLLTAQFAADQKVDEMIICGPGARNTNIIDYLETELPENVIIRPLDDIGIPGDASEAVCHAHLALETVLGRATEGSAPSTPGSSSTGFPSVGGKIVRGKKWEKTVQQAVSFSAGRQLPAGQNILVARNLEHAMRRLDMS